MGKKLQEDESFIFSWWEIMIHSVGNKDNTKKMNY